jgi:oligopeptide/dipeptide ABC transporter ATP-binding protein
LDVTIQAQILALMLGLKEELRMAMVLITHDLGVIAQAASRVLVMYAGEIVEEASAIDLFDHPFHPYTRGLLKSVPRLEVQGPDKIQRLNEIPGIVPTLLADIAGCKFADRCNHVFDQCRRQRPELITIKDGQRARCWLKDFPEQRKTNA